ncbi:hypothetical protein ACFXPX_36725 [Kitasatospora sp. NPDC059146]|uniref:hypothetical protein n=1 Tax=unclassified Kitasatospora TaxID=2633591 RepID=UPI0036867DB6
MRRNCALRVSDHLKAVGLAPADENHPTDVTTVLTEDGRPCGRPEWVVVTVVTGPWTPALETARLTLAPLGYEFADTDQVNVLLARRS